MSKRSLFLLAAVVVSTAAGIAVAVTGAEAAQSYYVAPNGNDSAAGTQAAPWKTIAKAQSVVAAGDTVYFRGGTYAFTTANTACSSQTARVDGVTLNKSGTAGNPIRYWAVAGEKPVFDFSGMKDDCRLKGFDVTGSYLHLKGLEITGVKQNNKLNAESWGIWISGSNNTFEQLNIHHIMGTGLFINGGAGNLVLNCDSHENYDTNSSDGPGENADGFGVHYMKAGTATNVLRGNRSWWNADDGFDLIDAYAPVLIENSWAWLNGYQPGTTNSAGNGNGFKAGGYGGDYDAAAVKHTVRFSVAFNNKAAGFYANHHPVANDFFNNTGYANHPNFNMLGVDSGNAAVGRGNLRNNVAYGGTATSNMSGTTSSTNTWDLGVTLNDAQFQSVSTSGWDAARQADGSLPVLKNLRPTATSSLIDKGANLGLPFTGKAPDLGAFEQAAAATTPPPASATGRLEAETAPAVCQGTIDADQAGFSGTGFCNGTGAVGAYAQFTVTAPAAGTTSIGVRFANGHTSGAARPANLIVNGVQVATVSFPSTGTWTAWTTTSLTVALNAGANTIKLDPTTAAGLPNIDYLDLGTTS